MVRDELYMRTFFAVFFFGPVVFFAVDAEVDVLGMRTAVVEVELALLDGHDVEPDVDGRRQAAADDVEEQRPLLHEVLDAAFAGFLAHAADPRLGQAPADGGQISAGPDFRVARPAAADVTERNLDLDSVGGGAFRDAVAPADDIFVPRFVDAARANT